MVSVRTEDSIGSGLEAMHVSVWQVICLSLAYDLRLYVGLNFK